VTEIVGGKEERNKLIYDQFLEKQDFSDFDLEKCLRRTMQTFRLAGVESQVVLRVMEGFSYKFHEHDSTKTFYDKDEAYEMAYLIIVLQTTMHNPNIKKKLRPVDFIMQAKSCCPKGYDLLPENYVNILYDNVKDEEIFSPLTRNWYQGEFNKGDLTMCDIKLCKLAETSKNE
jgi:brefeldin A-resistance guanine nucleotide exchange factor 1